MEEKKKGGAVQLFTLRPCSNISNTQVDRSTRSLPSTDGLKRTQVPVDVLICILVEDGVEGLSNCELWWSSVRFWVVVLLGSLLMGLCCYFAGLVGTESYRSGDVC